MVNIEKLLKAGRAIQTGEDFDELVEYAKDRSHIEVYKSELDSIKIIYKNTIAKEYKGIIDFTGRGLKIIDFTGRGLKRYEKGIPKNLSDLLLATNNMVIVDGKKYEINKPFDFAKELYRQNEEDEKRVDKIRESTNYSEEKTLAQYCSMKPTK